MGRYFLGEAVSPISISPRSADLPEFFSVTSLLRVNELNPKSGGIEVANEDLRDVKVVGVQGQEDQSVLHGAGRDPDVVCRNEAAGRPEEIMDRCIAFRRVLIHRQSGHAWIGQKLSQLVLVLFLSPAFSESGKKFADHDRIDADPVGLSQGADDAGVAFS